MKKTESKFKQWLTKGLLFALLITGVGPLENIQWSDSVNAEFEGGGVRASTLQTDDKIQLDPLLSAQLDGAVAAYEAESTFLSPVLKSDFTFDAVAMDWEEHRPVGTELEIETRFQGTDSTWGEWIDVHPDIDEKISDDDLKAATSFVNTDRSIAIQYRVEMRSFTGNLTPRLQSMSFHYIDTSLESDEDQVVIEVPRDVQPKLTFGDTDLDIISREEWGADETWRLASFFGVTEDEDEEEEDVEEDDAGKNGEEPTMQELYPEEFELRKTDEYDEDGNALYWKLDYAENVNKIFVHHTVSSTDEGDWEATIRAIYYYHAVRRGWGDIGYNYIIDPEGNIYEGRYGGERVVGGHAAGYNTGSIGIAVIGNYDNDDVPFEVIEALSSLIQEKSERYNIDVDGFSRFRGLVSANVMGHRDASSTRCPGANLYALLPTIRKVTAASMESEKSGELTDDLYAFASTRSYDPVFLAPEQTTQFTLSIKNTGTETWNQDTYLVANKNTNAEALIHLVKEESNSKSIANMAESSIGPGETATFSITAESMLRSGFESFDLTVIFNGSKKTSHYLNLPVYVESVEMSYDIESIELDEKRVENGKTITGEIQIKNTGNVSWYRDGDNPVVLGGDDPRDRVSDFLDNSNRYASLEESVVDPGEIGTFELDLVAPNGTKTYIEVARPVMEGVDWLEGDDITFEISVYDTSTQAVYAGVASDMVFVPGERRQIELTLENTGYLTWGESEDGELIVGAIHHSDIGVTKPTLEDKTVEPGETGEVTFYVTAPEEPGDYVIYLRPRLEKQNLVRSPIKLSFTVEESEVDIEITSSTHIGEGYDEELVRILLSYDEETFGSPIITADGAFDVYLEDRLFLDLDKGDDVEVRSRNGDYQIIYDAYAWIVDDYPIFVPRDEDTILEIENYENRPTWNTSLNDNLFRGNLEVQLVDDELVVINEVPMWGYLRGVAEAINSEPIEKVKTMAILARTYMKYYLSEEEKFPGMPYDGSDDPDIYQKYLGYGYEARAARHVDAVEDTAGLVVTYNGELVKTPYFSSTDGTSTKTAEEVWGWTHTPYLQSVEDPLCEGDAFAGHGVGLSGCGATAAAEQGFSYEEIIQYYYTGVEVEQR